MFDFLGLAEQVEASPGPDRELDMAICLAFNTGRKTDPRDPGPDRFTASIDAALTLLPEGWVIGSLEWWSMRKDAGVTLFETGETRSDDWPAHGYDSEIHRSSRARGKTPALALLAACIRAHDGRGK